MRVELWVYADSSEPHLWNGRVVCVKERWLLRPLEPRKRCSAMVVGLEPLSHGLSGVDGVHQAERIDFACDNDEE